VAIINQEEPIMPVHDWTNVDTGIFHDFHHAWIEEIKRALNAGLLPPDCYALAEQVAAGFGPDVLTLQADHDSFTAGSGGAGVLLEEPQVRLVAESGQDFYRSKQKSVVVRHVSGDRVVAVVEIVSQGNKSSQSALRSFLDKATELLARNVHLVIVDLFPPGPRDPDGIHAALWQHFTGRGYELPDSNPLTLAAYEAAISVRAWVEHVAVGDKLPAMPLFLWPKAHIPLPLEATYNQAFAAVPRRWRDVIDAK
jgi:hypothetical protein